LPSGIVLTFAAEKFNSADAKGAGINAGTAGGAAESRCFMCNMPASEWGSETTHRLFRCQSVLDVAKSFVSTCFDMVEESVGKASTLSLAEATAIRVRGTKEHGGLRFPAAVVGNPVAHAELRAYVGEELMRAGPCAEWSDEQHEAVDKVYSAILTTYAQLMQVPVPAFNASGHSLETYFDMPNTAHCIGKLLKAGMLDVLINFVPAGQQRNLVMAKFLCAGKPSLNENTVQRNLPKNVLSDHWYSYNSVMMHLNNKDKANLLPAVAQPLVRMFQIIGT